MPAAKKTSKVVTKKPVAAKKPIVADTTKKKPFKGNPNFKSQAEEDRYNMGQMEFDQKPSKKR